MHTDIALKKKKKKYYVQIFHKILHAVQVLHWSFSKVNKQFPNQYNSPSAT